MVGDIYREDREGLLVVALERLGMQPKNDEVS